MPLNPLSYLICAFFLAATSACSGQPYTYMAKDTPADAQIAEYVVGVFEDSKGNLWFGTMTDGAIKYDGSTLTYFTKKDGLPGNTVAGYAEDKNGNIWLATHSGLSRYNGNTFTNYFVGNNSRDNRMSTLLVTRKGDVWVGTWNGVYRYRNDSLEPFALPLPKVSVPPDAATAGWVTEIMEDKEGNIWIGRNGYGLCRYNGNTFTHFTKDDGLPSNNVQTLLQDNEGNIWIGCRKDDKDGGLTRYNGKTFTRFPETRGLSNNEVYAIHQDKAGNIWIGANGVGLYKYDGKTFTLYAYTNRKDLIGPSGYGIQDIREDKNGTLWLGLSGGLFRLKDSILYNVPAKAFK